MHGMSFVNLQAIRYNAQMIFCIQRSNNHLPGMCIYDRGACPNCYSAVAKLSFEPLRLLFQLPLHLYSLDPKAGQHPCILVRVDPTAGTRWCGDQ